MELCERARLLRLHILQVKAAHEEVITPDVLRDQVHLEGPREAEIQTLVWTKTHTFGDPHWICSLTALVY